MKAIAFCALPAVLFAACVAMAGELPARKPGLWKMTISQGEGAGEEQSTSQCIDEKTDAEMQALGSSLSSSMGGGSCGAPDIKKEGSSYVVQSSCKMMGTEIKSRAVLKGDFQTSYEGVTEATYNPPMMGMSESKTTIKARWLGSCAAGQKPGDIIMPNGMKMNLQGLRQMGQMMQGN